MQEFIHPTSTGQSAPISTGSIRLDLALGAGGLPRGQITELAGSCGKTTLCLNIISQAQAAGGTCAWIDSDLSFNKRYAAACGANLPELYISQTNAAEEAIGILDTLVRSGVFAVIVVDSLSSLVTQSEISASYDLPEEDFLSPLLSTVLPSIAKIIHHNLTIVIFTNQSSTSVTPVYHQLAGNPARLALPLWASIRMLLKSVEVPGQNTRSKRIQIQIIKNKFFPCIKLVELDIIVNRGFNKSSEILELGVQIGLVKQQGNRYFYQDRLLGNNFDGALQALRKNDQLKETLERAIRASVLPATA